MIKLFLLLNFAYLKAEDLALRFAQFRNEPYNKKVLNKYMIAFEKLNKELGAEYVEFVMDYLIQHNRKDVYSPNYFLYIDIRHLFEKEKAKRKNIANLKEREKEIGVGKTTPISNQKSKFVPSRNRLDCLKTDLKNKYGD